MNQLGNVRKYSKLGRGPSDGYPGRGNPNGRPPRRRVNGRRLGMIAVITVLVLALIVAGCLFLFQGCDTTTTPPAKSTKPSASTTPTPTVSTEPTETATPTPTPSTSVLPGDMALAPNDDTDPAKQNFTTNIYEENSKLSEYTRPQAINFGDANSYTSLEGVTTFRGNNYRNMSSYGTANVSAGELKKVWTKNSASTKKDTGTGAWTGSGWTGQALLVKWPDDVKKIMNLKEEYKSDPDFVEVIYPCLDGYIYFLDLKTGKPTRPKNIHSEVPHKGTASLYPNGVPMLFIGQGDTAKNSGTKDWQMRYRVYSLIDQTRLYTFGTDDPVKIRQWQAYDSSPLISADTDTLIEPGENGVLYTIKLNTQFDKAAGKLSIKPDKPIKFNYNSPKYGVTEEDKSSGKRSLGWETSAVIWRNYFISGDNGGTMTCIDLNTMKLVWAADVTDDTNSSPVLEESAADQTAYIYTANSIESQHNKDGECNIRKIDIKTGTSVWVKKYTCKTTQATEGGVEGTPILGKPGSDIENLIIYPLGRYPDLGTGTLVALDKNTGEEVWNLPTSKYLWSSPVTFYTPEGKAYIVECDTGGNIYVVDGKGKLLHKYTPHDYDAAYDEEHPGGAIEATPVVFNDMLVIGTRGQKIYCFKIT